MNEPVAWIDSETRCFVYSQYDYEDLDEYGKDGLIPLYTHPMRELTDEEMEDFTVRIYNCRTGAEAHEIVLAILRKAQEK